MNWKNLTENKCPKCSAYLKHSALSLVISCSLCDFMISNKRYNEIVNDMYRPKIRETFEDNSFDLNNL